MSMRMFIILFMPYIYRYIRLRGETEPISELIKQQQCTQQQQQQYTHSQQGTSVNGNTHK